MGAEGGPDYTTLSEIGNFRVTERSLNSYKETFSFDPESIPGNGMVLDIGSGVNQRFAKELETTRPDVKVVSLDPSLGIPAGDKEFQRLGVTYQFTDTGGTSITPNEEQRRSRLENKYGLAVAGLAPELPFKDGSFDMVFDNHAAFMYFSEDEKNSHIRYVKEMLRVLKSNGVAEIYPLDIFDENADDNAERVTGGTERITRILTELGFGKDRYEIFHFVDIVDGGKELDRVGVKIKK